MATTTTPRGIRNNNPLNIVHSKDVWMGRSETQTDPKFVQFGAMIFGIRAAMVCIRTYINKHKCDTIQSIVSRWCPDSTAATYVSLVSKRTGIPRSQVISFSNKHDIVAIVSAMAEVECGVLVWDASPFGLTPDLFNRAYEMI